MTGFFSSAAAIVLHAAFGLLTGALLLRLYLPLVGVSFAHPFGRFVLALTNWIVLPVRKLVFRILPKGKSGGARSSAFDWASVLCAYASEFVQAWLVRLVFGRIITTPEGLGMVAGLALLGLVRTALVGLFVLILVQAVISWVNPRSEVMGVVDPLTRPILRPLRRIVPLVGGIDLSPLVACVVLQIALLAIDFSQAAWMGLFR
jgi:YggT family protein